MAEQSAILSNMSTAELKRERRRKTRERIKKYKLRYFLMLPGIIYFVVYKYVPLYGILMAFQNFNPLKGVWGSEWVGLDHFKALFLYGDFTRALANTLIISLSKMAVGYVCTVFFALLLNELANGLFKRTVQTISYLPHFLSWVTIYGIALAVLGPEKGGLIQLMSSIGLPKINFFTDPRVIRSTLVLSNLWKGLGWGTIIYLAALSGIDPQLYEAAIIDGANRFKRMWHISIPGILPIIVITGIMGMGGILGENLMQILMFSNGLVAEKIDVFETIVFNAGLRGMNYSYATAVGLFQSVAGFILTVGANKLAKSLGQDGLW